MVGRDDLEEEAMVKAMDVVFINNGRCQWNGIWIVFIRICREIEEERKWTNGDTCMDMWDPPELYIILKSWANFCSRFALFTKE